MTSIFDKVINQYSIYTVGDRRRNERKLTTLISTDVLKEKILGCFNLNVTLNKLGNNNFVVIVKEFNIKTNAESRDEVITKTLSEVKTFVEGYISKADFYLRHPEMSDVFPYVLRLYYCTTDEEIKTILNLN